VVPINIPGYVMVESLRKSKQSELISVLQRNRINYQFVPAGNNANGEPVVQLFIQTNQRDLWNRVNPKSSQISSGVRGVMLLPLIIAGAIGVVVIGGIVYYYRK
jgi:hypothetical protein